MSTTATVTEDVIVINHGSVVLLQPNTQAARDWFAEHLSHPETQRWGNSVVCEPRYVEDIVDGMTNDGLTVE
jgi:hypothetical protein